MVKKVALSKTQKFKLAFNFTVSNTQTAVIEDYYGNVENYGINTGVFENLENVINFESLSEGKAKDLHTKLVWEKYNLYEINDVEVMIKVYDLFFTYGSEVVTDLVRDILFDLARPTPEFGQGTFGRKEIKLINDLFDQGKIETFLSRLIRDAKTRTTKVGTKKRIEKLPTL